MTEPVDVGHLLLLRASDLNLSVNDCACDSTGPEYTSHFGTLAHIISFASPSFPGNKINSTQQYNGRPIFINFWASWCPPCQRETPDLVQAFKKYGTKVQFIGVNMTSQDSIGDVKTFLKKYGIQYPIVLDKPGSVANAYNISGIPTSFFVNRSGVIVATYVGAIPPRTLNIDLQQISK